MPSQTFVNLEENKKSRVIASAIDEFATKPFEQVMISDIIKTAKIPRGSFYQYFTDKEDLYLYIIDLIREEKLKYISKTLTNIEGLPFLDLIRKLFEDGVGFAIENPKLVRILDHLLKNKNSLYDKLMADNMALAEEIYANLIEIDKSKGLIRQEINTLAFAKIVVQLTSNITFEELDLEHESASYEKMIERNEHIMEIIEYGVKKG